MEPTESVCYTCGGRANPGREAAIYLGAEHDEPSIVRFCSESCEAAANVEVCARCDCEIAKALDGIDLRDPGAYNFVMDEGGNPVCIRCAGIGREALDWHRHAIDAHLAK